MAKVFISYSHDSDSHRERVLALSERLREDGIETILDQYVNGSPSEGWPRWMLNQLDVASFVLVVCTETYYRRFRGHEVPGKGRGVDWEGALITQEIYQQRSNTLKFVPVLFATEGERFIPEPLRSLTHYTVNSEPIYQSLYDFILGVAGVEPRPIGQLKPRERRRGASLRFGGESKETTSECVADISRILKYAPTELMGRDYELKLLRDAWHGRTDLPVSPEIGAAQQRRPTKPRILIFVALGGEGKTSLVAKWAAELAAQDWSGCDAAFAWSFYSQGTREQLAASSDLFLKEALSFFGDDADKQFAASSAGPFEKGQRLARIVGQRRSLLILDGLEPLQYPSSATAFKPGELKDQGIAKLLKDLASGSHGLCIVTTRIELPDLQAFKGGAVNEEYLKRLSRKAGVGLLKRLGVKGSELRNLPLKDGDEKSEKVNEFEKLVEDVKGHALTLTLLGGFLKRAFHGDIRQRDRVKFEKADEKIDGGHAFRTMATYEQWLLRDGGDEGCREVAVLRLMGLFDRPADAGCLAALRSETISGLTEPLTGLADDDWEFCLSGLETAKLLTVNRDASGALVSLDAHPHLREYFAKQLREQKPEPLAWRAAHRRLYEHLCASTKEGNQPTLEDLQPLYQAVAHGCLAETPRRVLEQVLWPRIDQGRRHYAVNVLGSFASHLGAFSQFFVEPWRRISSSLPAEEQAFVFGAASFCLRATGRFEESLQPLQAGLEMRVAAEEWESASDLANNLSELLLVLGRIGDAVTQAAKSVEFAKRSENWRTQVTNLPALADALHQHGDLSQARQYFRMAEEQLVEHQPDHRYLYSSGGFRYCDLLLADVERAAWKPGKNIRVIRPICDEVEQRVYLTVQVANRNSWVLQVGLDTLTVARLALYDALFAPSDSERVAKLAKARHNLGGSLQNLRQFGAREFLLRGLLTSAWLTHLEGDESSARSSFDEAWEIAERGPMKLFLADIHLYRARLFGARSGERGTRNQTEKYPWESPAADLAAAEKLINECGYHRRDEELADAKQALQIG